MTVHATSRPQGKRVAVVQSNYLPWRGYFDLIAAVDEFILYDDVQYTKNDWRNRNRIGTHQGPQWLTIPIITKGRFGQLIHEAEIADPSWRATHWRSLAHNYGSSVGFDEFGPRFEAMYNTATSHLLSEVNRAFIAEVMEIFGITTTLRTSMEYGVGPSDPNTRLLALLQAADATSYLSGPAARDYLDIDRFAKAGIDVEFADYAACRPYPTTHPVSTVPLSIVDLIFSVGSDAAKYLKHTSQEAEKAA